MVPAIRATRGEVIAALRDHQSAGRRARALDKGVVAIQVGLAMLLLTCAGLLSATLRHLTEAVGGSHPETLLVVQLDARGTAHSDTLLQATVPTLHARFAAMPGVKSVVESYVVPLIYGGLPTRLLDAPGFENASDEQAEKLTGVFTGQLGGPMEALGPLIGESLGVERAPIEVSEDGLRHSVRIGNAVDFEVEDIVPFGKENGEPVRFDGMFYPAGSNLTMAEARRSRIDAFGIRYEGKTGLSSADFSWSA